MPCKFEYRCNHKKISLILCMAENNQPAENCYLYTLMEDVEKKKAKKPKEKK
jgi:hypothetical protein